MAVRSSMENLIAQVRINIGDPSSVDAVFTDQTIQDALDRRRRDVFRVKLTDIVSVAEGGVASTITFFADGGNWETDVTLQDPDYKVLTDATTPVAIASSDYIVGTWVMSAHQNAPVWLTGKQYDLNGAAADLLDAWIGDIKLEFDFLSGGRTFKRSQQLLGLQALVQSYRARQWIGYSTQVRLDMNG